MIRKLVPKVVPLLVVALAAGCTQPPPRPSVVLMVANDLSYGQLGSGGAPEARTPTLDALARSGLQFRTCVSQSPHPLPALATLLTGRFPSGHGALQEGYEIAPGVPMLAEFIRSRSYRTAAFLDGDLQPVGNGVDRGFDVFDSRFTRLSLSFHSLADTALAWVRSDGRPSFLVVTMGYGARSVEASARILLRGMEEDGTAPRTFFLLTALQGTDPGESGWDESLLPEWVLDVPMIVAAPEWISPALRDDPAMLVDVFPTALQGLGFAPARLPGRGLLRTTGDGAGGKTGEKERPLTAESSLFGWVRCVRLGDWKAVHDEREGDVWHLYDLAVDPGETRDLAADRPEELQRLQAAMPEPGLFYFDPPSPVDFPAPD